MNQTLSHPIKPLLPPGKGSDGMQKHGSYRRLILEIIEYDVPTQNDRLDRVCSDELVELMVDTVCSKREMNRIDGDDYPAEVVRSRFLKLNSSHIEYILERMREKTICVRNIKKIPADGDVYVPVTIDSYYKAIHTCLALKNRA